MKTVVLLSGGMDSVCLLYQVNREHEVCTALSFDYGSRHNPRELPFARWHCEKLGIPHITLTLDFINEYFSSTLLKSGGEIPEGHYQQENMKQTVVPFRNGIMLAIAAGLAESRDAQALAIAAHSGDHAIYPDCREEFMRSMEEAITHGTYNGVKLLRPFITMSKAQIALRGHELGVEFTRTWSCYKGERIHCGACGTCIERREAFILAGLPDPTRYAAHPPIITPV